MEKKGHYYDMVMLQASPDINENGLFQNLALFFYYTYKDIHLISLIIENVQKLDRTTSVVSEKDEDEHFETVVQVRILLILDLIQVQF